MYAKHKKQFFLCSKKICLFVLISAVLFILMIPAVSFANNIIEENENLLDKLDSTNDNADFLLKNPVAEKKKLNKLGAESNYLCLKPSNAGQSAFFQIKRYFNPTGKDFWYSYDLSEWKKVFESDDYTQVQTVDFTIDKPIYFKGNNPNGFSASTGGTDFYHFLIKEDLMDASGSVMSLLDNGEGTMSTIPNVECFYKLFGNLTKSDASTKLVTAPDLPATTLQPYCYQAMFSYCESLTTAPFLPAETLVERCYNAMFQDCSSLSYINVNFKDWNSSKNCTFSWTEGVNQNTDNLFICPPELDTTVRGDNYIPNNWTVTTDNNAHADVASYSSQYDGGSHGVSVSNIYPDKATVTYSNDGIHYSKNPITITDVGFTFVYIKIHRDGFNDYTTSSTIEIKTKEGATAQVQSNEKNYGQEDPSFTIEFKNILGARPVLGRDYVLFREPGEEVRTGGYQVTLHWIRDNNYDLTVTPGVLTINKANDLRLIADPASKSESQSDPVFTAHMDGLKFDDALGSDDYEIDVSSPTNRVSILTPKLTQTGKTNFQTNYNIDVEGFCQTATFTVYSDKVIKYNVNSINLDYDANDHEFKVTNVEPLTAKIQYSKNQTDWQTDTFKFKDAEGPVTVYYKITADDCSDVTGSETVTINKAKATLVADSSKLFKNKGESDPELSATLFGAVDGQTLTKGTDYDITRNSGEVPGTYDVNITVKSSNITKNYNIGTASALFTIIGAPESFKYSVDCYDSVYDGDLHEFKINVEDPISDYTVKYKYGDSGWVDSTFKFSDVGEYTIQFQITATGYYPIEDSQTLKIKKAHASLAADISKCYKNIGETEPELTAILYGAAESESLIKDVDYEILRTPGEDSGVYDVSIELIENSKKTNNYDIEIIPAKFFILGSGDVPPTPVNPTYVNSVAQTGDDLGFAVIMLVVVAIAGLSYVAYRVIRKNSYLRRNYGR